VSLSVCECVPRTPCIRFSPSLCVCVCVCVSCPQECSKKSVALLYTKDKLAEKEIRERTSFTVATNNIKYLGVTLTKQVKDLYDKNSKFLKKEIEEYIRP